MKLNRKQFCALFKADFFVVGVKFDDPPHYQQRSEVTRKVYSYKVLLGTEVVVGDWVYVPDVDSADVTKPNLKRARVETVIKDTDAFQESGVGFKWIVGTVDEVLSKYAGALAQDVNLMKAVNKLERAMDRVELQAQMKLALELLSPEERTELTDSLGLDLTKVGLTLAHNK